MFSTRLNVSHSFICLFTCTQFDPELSSRQFGVELSQLTTDDRAVPLVVEKLINYIEIHGLYTEGIYRKSGSTNKIKELKMGLDTGEWGVLFSPNGPNLFVQALYCKCNWVFIRNWNFTVGDRIW